MAGVSEFSTSKQNVYYWDWGEQLEPQIDQTVYDGSWGEPQMDQNAYDSSWGEQLQVQSDQNAHDSSWGPKPETKPIAVEATKSDGGSCQRQLGPWAREAARLAQKAAEAAEGTEEGSLRDVSYLRRSEAAVARRTREDTGKAGKPYSALAADRPDDIASPPSVRAVRDVPSSKENLKKAKPSIEQLADEIKNMKFHYELLLSAQDGKWNARFGTLATEILELKAEVKAAKKDTAELASQVKELLESNVSIAQVEKVVKTAVKNAAIVTAKAQVVESCRGYGQRFKHVEERLAGLDKRVDGLDEEAFKQL